MYCELVWCKWEFVCVQEIFWRRSFCALYFWWGNWGGKEVVGEKWGVWYHIVCSLFFSSLWITSYLVKWCGVPEVVVHIILY